MLDEWMMIEWIRYGQLAECQGSWTLLSLQIPPQLRAGLSLLSCSICNVGGATCDLKWTCYSIECRLDALFYEIWVQNKAIVFLLCLTFTSLHRRNRKHTSCVSNWTVDQLSFASEVPAPYMLSNGLSWEFETCFNSFYAKLEFEVNTFASYLNGLDRLAMIFSIGSRL